MNFKGTLDPCKMTKGQKQGYVSWANQRSKCNNSKNPDYKYYGGKGIRVKYSSREFVGWWIKNLSKKSWQQPTVGRIDHDGDYCFENIEMQERRENISERCRRLGRPIPEKTAAKRTLLLKFGQKVAEFRTISEASAYAGVDVGHACRIANGHPPMKVGWDFQYIKKARRELPKHA